MLQCQPDYTVAIERLRPFEDMRVLEPFINDLRIAGLPE
jgi:hypothetical protein